MLAKILKRRRDRRNLDYSLLMAEPDPVFGRLDGKDPTGFVPGLSPSGGLGPDDLAMDGQLPLERADGKPLYYAGLEGFPPTAWRCTACGELAWDTGDDRGCGCTEPGPRPLEPVDPAYAEMFAVDETQDEQIDNRLVIQMLEAQLEAVLGMLKAANETVEAAKEFARAITAINLATGEPVYKTVLDDELATQLLNHRYSDLAALLNGSGRPVPGKLTQGTVH